MQSPLGQSEDVDIQAGVGNVEESPRGATTSQLRLVTYVGLTTSTYGYTLACVIRAWLDDGTTCNIVVMIGTILGLVGFGSLADSYGRGRRILCAIAGLQLLAFAGAAMSRLFDHMQGTLVVSLFLLGLGLGGEYPVAASQIVETMSRHAPRRTAMRKLGGAYLCMGFGQVLAPLILLSCISWDLHSDNAWSVVFAVGALLSVVSLGFRWYYAEETQVFLEQRSDSHPGNTLHENSGTCNSRGLALLCQTLEPFSRALLGTCIAACLFNVITGGMTFHKELMMVFFSKSHDDIAIQETFAVFVAMCLSFPGYMLAPVVARQMRRQWQFGGFLLTAIGLLALAAATHDAHSQISCVVYAMLLSLVPCSLGATAHFVPAEVFPTCVRATCIGISLAAGELGSMFAVWALRALLDAANMQIVVLLLAVLSLLGVLSTFFLTPLYDQRTLQATIQLRPGKDARQSTIDALEQAEAFRACPRCEVMVERDGGCNIITCANCNEAWCFVCGGLNCTAYACSSVAGANGAPTLETLPQILWPVT